MDKEAARRTISELVERYSSHRDEYESSGYLESQLRTDFIDELFKALDWDLVNKKKLSPLQREVLVEKGDTKGRPDYSFRVNGEDRFFVEAKAASKGTDKPEDIFQAKRYGWNTRKVTIAVLTDFKSFKVFDASLKPQLLQPRVGLLFELDFTKFTSSDFEKLCLFSHEQVAAGSLDTLAMQDASSKRLRIPVDIAFLEQMTEWRETLAKDIYKNNPNIEVRGLNEVVQKLLDRLVFIRILEDRKIIESKSLRDITERWEQAKHRDIQPHLNALFKQLNNDFNGEIFKDHMCETAKYDSKVVAEIISELYYPKSPYDFSVIGVELLGIIYEKYLGKTIRLTEKRVKVEEKPEVRKAGGVFYTPKYIVEEIVHKTVGKLIENKKPIEMSNIRILDPACGSGSFLIGALDCLFHHHLNYYVENQKEAKSGTLFPNLIVEMDEDGNKTYRLSIEKKGEILRNNIYGVDIDPQAVEITMMSLYIKTLEGERTLPHNKELLPSLSNNIKCGNSLIGFDFLEQTTLVGDTDKERVNPFEWKSKSTGFGRIIDAEGGFDAIIGNPPYIRAKMLEEIQRNYFTKKYTSAVGTYDIYVLFIEKSFDLLKENGLLGFINPNKYFYSDYGSALRKLICEKHDIHTIIDFNEFQVFDEATTYTTVNIFRRSNQKSDFIYFKVIDKNIPLNKLQEAFSKNKQIEGTETFSVSHKLLVGDSWIFKEKGDEKIIEKVSAVSTPLIDLCYKIYQGFVLTPTEVFPVSIEKEKEKSFIIKPIKKDEKTYEIEKELIVRILKSSDIKKFHYVFKNYYAIFPYHYITKDKVELVPQDEMEKKYPKTLRYLEEKSNYLKEREEGRWRKSPRWYEYSRNQNFECQNMKKILVPGLATEARYCIGEAGVFIDQGSYGVILNEQNKIHELFIMGLLNSKLLDFCLKSKSGTLSGAYYNYQTKYLAKLPIFKIDLNQSHQKKIYSEIVELVEKSVKICSQINNNTATVDKQLHEREAKFYEEKLDQLVYDLYGLTGEERKMIDNSVRVRQ